MIPDEVKISIAMDLIEKKLSNYIIKRREYKDEELEKKYKSILIEREEIYKGNYKIIDKIINEAGEDKND